MWFDVKNALAAMERDESTHTQTAHPATSATPASNQANVAVDPDDVARVTKKHAESLAALAKTKLTSGTDPAVEPTEENEPDDCPEPKP